jgi:meso-butanediol dehydrogenase/(S,S)-butanediol dehydrogenase/diacetyl reductase
MFDFTAKKVFVTGGARGIGAAAARAFHARGASVAIGAREAASFDAFGLPPGGGRIIPVAGDIRDQAGARRVVAAAIDALGGLDVLVNSAGVFAEVPVDAVTQGHWDEMLTVNLGGTFFCSQAALPALRAAGGNIVNVASDAGLVGYPRGAAYSAAKGGVVNLTRAMAVELAREVRVNCVCPGNVDTEMIRQAADRSGDAGAYLEAARHRAPNGRMATAAEVAAAILYLASSEAASTTGAALAVDGGGTAGF